jgi:hypothetical protein
MAVVCFATARSRAARTAEPSVAMSYALSWRLPLIKKLGVPSTPLASALASVPALVARAYRAGG